MTINCETGGWMILKILGFFILVLTFVFSNFSFAKNPKQPMQNMRGNCDPKVSLCGSSSSKAPAPSINPDLVNAKGPSSSVSNPVPLQLPGGGKPKQNAPISQAPFAATAAMQPQPSKGHLTVPKASTSQNKKRSPAAAPTFVPPPKPEAVNAAKSKSPAPPADGKTTSLVNGKLPDAEVGKFLDFCSENPGHETCGGAKVRPNPKVVTKVPVQVITKEPVQIVTKNPVNVIEGAKPKSTAGEQPAVVTRPTPVVQQPQEEIVQTQETVTDPNNQVINNSLQPVQQVPVQQAQEQNGSACGTNFSFSFNSISEVSQWNSAWNSKGNKGVTCDMTQTSSYNICCSGDPGVDSAGNPYKVEEPENVAQEKPQENNPENPEPLTEKEKQYCHAAEEAAYQCQNEFAPAERNCDPEDGSIGQWTRSMQTAADGLRAISQTSIQAACSGMVTMAGGMNAALTTFETMCQSSRETCVSSCRKAKASIEKCPTSYKGFKALEDSIATLDDYTKQCQGYGNRVESAKQNANGVMQSIQNSQQCAAYTKAMNQPTICQRDPLAPGCGGLGAQNCDNPAFAASNMVCVCLRSPRDPRCQNSASQGATGFGAVAGGAGVPNLPGGMAGTLGENAGGGGAGMDFSSLSEGGAGGAGAPGEDPGGKKGSGAPLNPNGGSGGGGGSSAGGGAGGYERNSQQVYNGNWGSGSKGGGFALGRPGGGTGGGNNGYYRNPSSTDFNQFRPLGKMNKFSPGLSGLTGPDGLTGPNSGTIWQKVRNRYQAKSYSLKQRP